MVGEPLASVLRSGRDLFNAKFAQARRKFPSLDAGAFGAFMTSTVDPLTREIPLRGEALAAFVQAAYDAALELAGEGLVGSDAKARTIEQAWRELAPRLKPAVLSSADTALAALSNAVHNLTKARGARPEAWIADMKDAAPHCETVELFLQVGQVIAWRSGMAQLRPGALDVARGLPENLRRLALRIPAGVKTEVVLERLKRDVWFDPSASDSAAAPLRAIKKVGAFRGLGGDFISPPAVAAHEDQLFVQSGEDYWLLIADVFGFSLHRAKAEEFEAARRLSASSGRVRATPKLVAVDEREAAIDLPGEITSFALLSHTVAVTSTLTHGIQLLARQT